MAHRGSSHWIALALLWLITPYSASVAADTAQSLLLGEYEQQLGPYSAIYLDTTGKLSAASALKQSFSPVIREYVRFVEVDGSYWLKFKLQNDAQYPQRRILSLDYPHVKRITLYVVRDGVPTEVRSLGVTMPPIERDIRSRFPALDFHLAPNSNDEYLLNIVFFGKANHALEYELRLYPEQSFFDGQSGSFIIFAGYIGFMMSLLIYNMILYRSLGIRGYLYYSLYLVSQIIGVMSYEGFFYLIPGPFSPGLVIFFVTITPTLCGLFLINFGRDLLQLRERMPRMNVFYIRVSLVLMLLMAVSPLGLGWLNIAMELLGVSMIVCTAIISVYVYRMGSDAARYFAISFAFLTVGYGVEMWLFSVDNLDNPGAWISPEIQYWMERYFYYSCSFFQMNFLSRALASFMVQIGEEKDKAQRMALENMEESNRLKEDYSHQLEHDITERTAELTRQSEIMAGQTAKLRQLDTMKSRFFANISHEFRTPLTLIRGPVQGFIAGDYGKQNGKAEDALDICNRNVERLARLIDELLMLSELESGALRLKVCSTDLGAFCKRTSGLFTHTAQERDIEFEVNIPEDCVELCFDPNKLETVLCNLLSNAFKYTPRGGTVELALENPEDNHKSTGSFVDIVVQDNGPGINPAEQANIFDRFYRASSTEDYAVEGSGIGLALVRELVELHGGDVRLDDRGETSSRSGCRFVVSLPLGADHLASEEILYQAPGLASTQAPGLHPDTHNDGLASGAPASVSIAAEHDATLLLVEDNKEMRDFIASQFDRHYHLFQARQGKEAIELLGQHRVDLVISDVMMPEMDGIGLLEYIRNTPDLQHLPVILLTARASDEDRLLALRARADDFMAKPFSSEELVLKVGNLLSRQAVVDAIVPANPSPVIPAAEVNPADSAFLEKARQIAGENLDNADFDVDALAAALFMSRSTLQRHMEKVADTTPALFIRQLRLELAHRYISGNSHRTLAETAYAVGFRHPGYFSRLYKKYTAELAAS